MKELKLIINADLTKQEFMEFRHRVCMAGNEYLIDIGKDEDVGILDCNTVEDLLG